MTKKLPVCEWLLEGSEGKCLVNKLEVRLDRVLLGNSEKLGIEDAQLIVPGKIEVYHVLPDLHQNNAELFFLSREHMFISPAYLSKVETRRGWLSEDVRDTGTLLDFPWYNSENSTKAFERLKSGRIEIIHGLTEEKGPHPFSPKYKPDQIAKIDDTPF